MAEGNAGTLDCKPEVTNKEEMASKIESAIDGVRQFSFGMAPQNCKDLKFLNGPRGDDLTLIMVFRTKPLVAKSAVKLLQELNAKYTEDLLCMHGIQEPINEEKLLVFLAVYEHKYRCNIDECKRSFKSERGLTDHQERDHPERDHVDPVGELMGNLNIN